MEKLAGLVRTYRCLYDCRHPGFTDHLAQREAWKAIGRELGVIPNEAENEWKRLRCTYLENRRQGIPVSTRRDRVMSFMVECYDREQKPNLEIIPLPAPSSVSFSSADTNLLHHEQRSRSISDGHSSSTQRRKREIDETCDAIRNEVGKWRKHPFNTTAESHSGIGEQRRRDFPTSIRFDRMMSFVVDYSGREPSLTIIPLPTSSAASNFSADTSNVSHEQNLRSQSPPDLRNGVPMINDTSQDGTFDWIVSFLQSVELRMRQLPIERQNVMMRKITDVVFEA